MEAIENSVAQQWTAIIYITVKLSDSPVIVRLYGQSAKPWDAINYGYGTITIPLRTGLQWKWSLGGNNPSAQIDFYPSRPDS